MLNSMIGENGCCLNCVESGKCDEPCYNCICSKCDWYIDDESNPAFKATGNRCFYIAFKKEVCNYSEFKIIFETEMAIQVMDIKNKDLKYWLPKSQIKIKKEKIIISIPNWLAEGQGINKEGWFELNGLTFKQLEDSRLTRKYDWR